MGKAIDTVVTSLSCREGLYSVLCFSLAQLRFDTSKSAGSSGAAGSKYSVRFRGISLDAIFYGESKVWKHGGRVYSVPGWNRRGWERGACSSSEL